MAFIGKKSKGRCIVIQDNNQSLLGVGKILVNHLYFDGESTERGKGKTINVISWLHH